VSAATVWLASYPKSGNTWLRAVVTALQVAGPVSLHALTGGRIASDRATIDDALGLPTSSMTRDEVELVRPRVDEIVAAEATDPLLRKVHDGWFAGPSGEPIVSTAATRAAVYMVRDPRDVAVSYAHHAGKTLEWACRRLGDPDAAMGDVRNRLDRQVPQRLGTWSEHVRSWVDDAPFPVEVIRFEDCAAAPVATFLRALRAAGFESVTEHEVGAAVEHASFARLHAAELEGGFRERTAEAPDFFRRGEPGAWRDELPADLATRIERDHAEVMARFGYEPA
jgi:aryl sulfotransferase